MLGGAVLALGTGWSAPAAAGDAPLSLPEVLGSVDATHPKLEAAERGVEKATADQLSARGGWDPTLSVRGKWVPVGYYENGTVDTTVRQATPLWGVGVYAGYRLGWGSFPDYRGGQRTLSGGELRAGIDVPLWKDGPIDPRRAGVRTSDALADATRCDMDATQLDLRRRAAGAYWRWVATGQEVRIQRELLSVAEDRDRGLREQAKAGSVPGITVVDNERLVLDRRSKLVDARREFQAATIKLSLYMRDAELKPILADGQRVPAQIPDVRLELAPETAEVQDSLSRRPEVCALQRERDAAAIDVRLKRNQRAPSINAQGFVARDLGIGSESLQPVELGVGLSFEMPLALRKARGELKAARAEKSRVDARLRGAMDRVAAEIRTARVELEAAGRQVELAARQVAVAQELADAERDKFREGASNLVIVNLRELAAANSARLEVEARADHQKARADYLSATGRGL
jgi:outer membrane protein TolC